MIVVDASVVAGWFLPGEIPHENALKLAAQLGIRVPSVWPLEIENILLVAERRGRINAQLASEILATLTTQFHISIDERTDLFGAVLPLARAHNLTSYDASYVEVSLRRKLPLYTTDKKLAAAAIALGVLAE